MDVVGKDVGVDNVVRLLVCIVWFVCIEDIVEFFVLFVLCCLVVILFWIVGECEVKEIGEEEVVVDVVDVDVVFVDDDDDDDIEIDDVEDGKEVVVDFVVGWEFVVVDVFVVVRNGDVVNDMV